MLVVPGVRWFQPVLRILTSWGRSEYLAIKIVIFMPYLVQTVIADTSVAEPYHFGGAVTRCGSKGGVPHESKNDTN
jgi:hypothetical protein